MAAPRQLPDSATLRRLRLAGWTQRKIADTYGVSESAVWKRLERAGYTQKLATYKDILPWDIADEHKAVAIMERFRAIVKQREKKPLRPEEASRLKAWLKELQEKGLVVAYHKDAPPNSASSKGGFYYVPRVDSDEWIIRKPAS